MEVRIFFVGDIVGRAGLEFCLEVFPTLQRQYPWDVLIVNGENIVNGKGLSEKEAERLFEAGVDVITTGNHIWENWKARPLLTKEPRVLRPHNYPARNPGKGYIVQATATGITYAVVQLQGRVFLPPIDCPFRTVDSLLRRLRAQTPVIVLDFHAEATAEKQAMGWYVDGRVSLMVGTHTHVQTADARILPGGTGYITDVGMTGPHHSVIGMRKEIALRRFLLQTAFKYEVAEEDLRLSAVYAVVDSISGKAHHIEAVVYPPFQ